MNRKFAFSVFLIVSLALSLEYAHIVWAEPAGWNYKRTLTLNPPTSTPNYQIMVELNTTSFDYSKADPEGDDIRFYNTSDSELSYWIETWNTTGTSTIWVKVPTSGTDTIYMYYDNPPASPESNADSVFLFFDDFNDDVYTDKWDVSGTLDESGGTLNLYPGSYATSKSVINGQPLIMEDRKQRLWPYEAYSGLYSNTTDDFVRSTDSSYTGEGGYYDGNRLDHGGANFGGFALGVEPSSTDMLVYQMVIDGTDVSLVRGVSFDTLGQYISSTLNTNFDNFDYKVGLFLSTYMPGIGGKYDWVRIREYVAVEPAATVGEETSQLTIFSSPVIGVSFTIDGTPETTTYSEWLATGSYTIEMPEIHTVGDARYYWSQWSDGNTSRTRIILLDANTTLTAEYTGPYYELTVTSSPFTGIPFTINGEPHTTEYSDWLLEGSYTIAMPTSYVDYVWSHWLEDGDLNRIRTVTLPGSTWTAVYEIPVGGASTAITSDSANVWAASILLIVSLLTASSLWYKRKSVGH